MKKTTMIVLAILFSASCVFAQQRVGGVVTTEDGDPLIGVNVVEKGTTNGMATGLDGTFALTVPANAILSITYTGYQTQEIVVGNRTSINVKLVEGKLLDEVVVGALGIERSIKALPYSVTTIGGDKIRTAKEVHIGNTLAGKIAGVNVSSPATGPGGSTRIVIRGSGNISGSNQPLIVVDGVPINNTNLGSAGMWGGQDWGDGLGSVNADDVESMTVLKGNTAAALYGYRAENGVILITTKKGSAGGLSIDFNSNFQAQSYVDNLDFQKEYGHGLDGVKPNSQTAALESGLYSWGEPLDGSSVVQFDGVSRPYSDAGDNLSRFYRTGKTFTNSLALSGGNESSNFRLSFTDLDNTGIIPNSGMNRRTFSTSASGRMGKFTANISGSFVNEDVQNRPNTSDAPGNANYGIQSLPVTINADDFRGADGRGALADGSEFLNNDNIFITNPWWSAYKFSNSSKKNRLFGSAGIGYEIIEGLTLSGRLGMDRFNERRTSLTPYGTGYSPLGQMSERNREVQEINLEARLRYIKDISDNFGIDIFVGGNQQKNSDESIGVGGSNFIVPFLQSVSNLANSSPSYGYSQFQVNSIFGQAEFSIFNSLYVTLTGRQDWFSALTDPNGGDSENSVFYPSVGVAYDLVSGLQLPSSIEFLKIRAGWAQVGGATAPYKLGLQYGIRDQGHQGQPLGAINNNSVPPVGLKPSTNTELEIGFDLRMFGGRLGFDVAYYDRETVDGILDATIAAASGFGRKTVNVGKVTNKGIEMLLNVMPIATEKLRWNLSLNYTHNKNKVVSLLTPEEDGEFIRLQESRTRNAYIHLVEGLPFSQVMGIPYERDASGNIMLNDDGLPMQGALRAFGTGVHPTAIGINNSFEFGNFNVGFLIDIRSGGVIYNATNSFAYLRGLHKETLVGRTNGIGDLPKERIEDYYGRIGGGISEEFIDDASFAKLREVIIGFSLPQSIMNDLPFKSARLSFAARNLLVLSKHTDNIDPESTYTSGEGQGLEMFGVPVTRSYGLNLNVKF